MSVTRELDLQTVSISKTEGINNVPWAHIQQRLGDLFDQENCVICICKNLVRIPDEDHLKALRGHKSVIKSYSKLRKRYIWENMNGQIQIFIQNCLYCQLQKLVRDKNKQPMLRTDTPCSSFDKVALDVVDPLSQTLRGNKYILTIQDQLTKFSLAIPFANTTSIDIANDLISCLICKFETLQAVLTDQSLNFWSTSLKAIARKFKIKQYKTTAFYPQLYGSPEESHHVLMEYLKQFTNKEKDWDE